jgi:excisionase family DNA binding protein
VPTKFVSVREVCDRYGLSDKTIRRKIKNGELNAYRVGPRLIKLDAEQVEAALLRPASQHSDLASAVSQVLATWPPLTDEQLDRIAALLRAGSSAGGDAA